MDPEKGDLPHHVDLNTRGLNIHQEQLRTQKAWIGGGQLVAPVLEGQASSVRLMFPGHI